MTRRTDRRGEPTDEYLEELDGWWERVKDLYPLPKKSPPEAIPEPLSPKAESEPIHHF